MFSVRFVCFVCFFSLGFVFFFLVEIMGLGARRDGN